MLVYKHGLTYFGTWWLDLDANGFKEAFEKRYTGDWKQAFKSIGGKIPTKKENKGNK